MIRKFHGFISLILIVIAVIFGAVIISRVSPLWAVVYLILSMISALLIVYSFCSKCPCNAVSCGHFFPGKIAQVLPKREEGLYGALDYVGVLASFIILFLFPQYWLRNEIILITIFWGLVLIALLDIAFFVCKGCENKYCPLHR
ncbi:MAG: hypothetical protein FH758_09500 [Firmicutes bacterium]|nr:hypothetical protein [Bacillota bacterium]